MLNSEAGAAEEADTTPEGRSVGPAQSERQSEGVDRLRTAVRAVSSCRATLIMGECPWVYHQEESTGRLLTYGCRSPPRAFIYPTEVA